MRTTILKYCVLFLGAVTTTAFGKKHYENDLSTPLTIAYSIEMKAGKNGTGIGESYNGGVKTVFMGKQQIRLRLVSLMRIQSMFIDNSRNGVTIIKESGKNNSRTNYSEFEWQQMNAKYEGAVCTATNETEKILGYHCRKSILTLKDKTIITVYHTEQLKTDLFKKAEPMFASVPGVVLKYEFNIKKAKITYKAMLVSSDEIDDSVFKIQ